MSKEPKPAKLLRLLATAEAGAKWSKSLPAALDECRKFHGLSWPEFAAILGMQISHMSEVRNGKRPLPIKATRRAFALGVPAAALLQQFESKP